MFYAYLILLECLKVEAVENLLIVTIYIHVLELVQIYQVVEI